MELMDDVISWFAVGISNIILLYDPQIIVIQGIFAKAGEYFLDNLRIKVNEISLPKIKKETKIEYSKLGDLIFKIRSIFFARSLDLVLIKYLLLFKDTLAKLSEFSASLIFSGEAFSSDFFNLNSRFLSRRKARKQITKWPLILASVQ
ncbi:unnamed protein product [marine sediment metagenome]|uniref:Uncharacterized protein n=1 Tax=marine sediment metagenome TaxID=412755 RepID=X1LTM4_9ZZZZ